MCEALYTATQSRLNRPKAIERAKRFERPKGFERCTAALHRGYAA